MDPVTGIGLGLSALFLAVVLHITASMTKSGALVRGGAVGIRTRATKASDEAWAAGHLAAAPWMVRGAVLGYVLGGLGLVLATVDMARGSGSPLSAVLAAAGSAGSFVLLLVGAAAANSAARATSAP